MVVGTTHPYQRLGIEMLHNRDESPKQIDSTVPENKTTTKKRKHKILAKKKLPPPLTDLLAHVVRKTASAKLATKQSW